MQLSKYEGTSQIK